MYSTIHIPLPIACLNIVLAHMRARGVELHMPWDQLMIVWPEIAYKIAFSLGRFLEAHDICFAGISLEIGVNRTLKWRLREIAPQDSQRLGALLLEWADLPEASEI
ncbi:MAG: hypothetical protein EBZ75_13680 [Oxalobacteraceae bacterium]|nr:hypothetical protein [Oxalobacteraceae bacterium]